jgi:glutamate/aspartate transport system permease protein
MNYHWNWAVIAERTVLGRGTYLEWLVDGACRTVMAGLAAWALALVLGILTGSLMTVNHRLLRRVAKLYIEVARNIPLIVQMFLWYFVMPELLPREWSHWVKREMPYPEFATAVVALALYTAARIAIQVQAGIEALPRGQALACRALGMSTFQSYRFVLLPSTLRVMAPTLTSEFMAVFKNTSVALTIGLLELTAQARAMSEYTFQGFEAFALATLLYLLIALTAYGTMSAWDRSLRTPGPSNGST